MKFRSRKADAYYQNNESIKDNHNEYTDQKGKRLLE